MALKKDFLTGTKYYYDVVREVLYNKDTSVEIILERHVKDTSDVEYDEVETMNRYCVQSSEFAGYYDTASLDVASQNFVERSYQYLKDNIESYNGWTDV